MSEVSRSAPESKNRTIKIYEAERSALKDTLFKPTGPITVAEAENSIVCGDMFDICASLPDGIFDMLFLDPPYNMNKNFGGNSFKKMDDDSYREFISSVLQICARTLKPDACVYICGDWKSGVAIHEAVSKFFKIRNRITWEREKGRGAWRNWKNVSEDIWFATVSDDYHFDPEAVKLKRRVLAPYRDTGGAPKDWQESDKGKYRMTFPSNLWTDITVPFWSMPENTPHPTQKPEKLMARLLLSSTAEGGFVLDPFAGSGTTAAVCAKLGRRFFCVESNEEFCLYAAKRVLAAQTDRRIQGIDGSGVFLERNTKGAD